MEGSRKEDIAIARANLNEADADLGLSRVNLAYTSLHAPSTGVITVREAELGEVVSPGTPVITLADLDHIWLRAYVAETDLGRIHWGQEATSPPTPIPASNIMAASRSSLPTPSSRPKACRPTRSGSHSSTASRSTSTIRTRNSSRACRPTRTSNLAVKHKATRSAHRPANNEPLQTASGSQTLRDCAEGLTKSFPGVRAVDGLSFNV